MPDQVIIEVALNGPTPRTRNRHVPRSPAEITEAAMQCIDLGAAIIHNHNDEPLFTPTGVHSAGPYKEAWRPLLQRHPEALLYPTMASGADDIPIERRWAHVEELAREFGSMTLIDPGSLNLGLIQGDLPIPNGPHGCYQNTYADTAYMFTRTAELHSAPSISIFEPGFARTLNVWHRAGLVPAGAMVKLFFGGALEFGLPPTESALAAYLELIEPTGLPWSVAVLGGDVVECGLAELAIRRGGHVRVGLEDYVGHGEPSNADLMRSVVGLVDRLGHSPATFAEARHILGIPVTGMS